MRCRHRPDPESVFSSLVEAVSLPHWTRRDGGTVALCADIRPTNNTRNATNLRNETEQQPAKLTERSRIKKNTTLKRMRRYSTQRLHEPRMVNYVLSAFAFFIDIRNGAKFRDLEMARRGRWSNNTDIRLARQMENSDTSRYAESP